MSQGEMSRRPVEKIRVENRNRREKSRKTSRREKSRKTEQGSKEGAEESSRFNDMASHIGAKLYGPIQRRRDGLTVGHPELEEHTQHVVSLADQYAFGGMDHFDPEEERVSGRGSVIGGIASPICIGVAG